MKASHKASLRHDRSRLPARAFAQPPDERYKPSPVGSPDQTERIRWGLPKIIEVHEDGVE